MKHPNFFHVAADQKFTMSDPDTKLARKRILGEWNSKGKSVRVNMHRVCAAPEPRNLCSTCFNSVCALKHNNTRDSLADKIG